MAHRVGRILAKVKGIENPVFDTTGSGYFAVHEKFEPDRDELQELLVEKNVRGVSITRLEEVDVPVAAAAFEVAVKGLG